MNCYKCNGTVDVKRDVCSKCGTDIRYFKKIVYMSNRYYNEGLLKAQARDLTGARDSLKKSLQLYKKNINARNLLGLVDYAMGESAEGLKEWVISKGYLENGNAADRYINHTRRNAKDLDSEDHGIRKFNQALGYAKTNAEDLAVIQLKKVISVHPNMTKAYLLLALLYIQNGKYDPASRMLTRCLEVDRGNTMALYYLKELERMNRKGSSKSAGTVGDADREQLIIPVRFRDFGSYMSNAVYILVGAAIGIAIAWFVIVPTKVAKQTAGVLETNRAYESQISELQQQVAAASAQLEESESADESETGSDSTEETDESGSENASEEAETAWYAPVYPKLEYWADNNDTLIKTVETWEAGNIADAMILFASLDPTLISSDISDNYYNLAVCFVDTGIYNQVLEEAQSALDAGDAATAASYYDIASEMQRGESLPRYNAARAYEENGDTEEAAKRYALVVNLFPDSQERADSEERYKALTGETEVPGLPEGTDPSAYTTNHTVSELTQGLDYSAAGTAAASSETAAGNTAETESQSESPAAE